VLRYVLNRHVGLSPFAPTEIRLRVRTGVHLKAGRDCQDESKDPRAGAGALHVDSFSVACADIADGMCALCVGDHG
jgi:hypothetical protein